MVETNKILIMLMYSSSLTFSLAPGWTFIGIWRLEEGCAVRLVGVWWGCGYVFLLASFTFFSVLTVTLFFLGFFRASFPPPSLFRFHLTLPEFLRLTSPNLALRRTVQPSVESKMAWYTRTMPGSTHELYLTSPVGAALCDGGGGCGGFGMILGGLMRRKERG